MTKSELVEMLEDIPDDYEIGVNDGGLFKDFTIDIDDCNRLLGIKTIENWI